jgi:hypothetical protein
MKLTGTIGLQGDYGTLTGKGKIVLADMPVEAYGDAISALQTFHAALVTAQLTATNIAQCKPAYNDEVSGIEPAADVNIDRKLVALWHTTTDSTSRKITISGVPATSSGITLETMGERLNAVGRGALAGALESVYGLTADTVIVDQGYVIQSK